jgi:hypothetical protein
LSLHSIHDPEKEAERFVSALNLSNETNIFILIEPGLNYIAPHLKGINEKAKIISLRCADNHDEIHKSDYNIHDNIILNLEKLIDSEDTIKIIEWRPALKVYAEKYVELLKAASAFFAIHETGRKSVAYFSKKRQINSKRNLSLLKNIVCGARLPPVKQSILVVLAGPGLNNKLCLIKERNTNNKPFIITVSSALKFFIENNIMPDIVVSTDSGYWTTPHFYEYARLVKKNALSKKPLFIVSNTANIPTFLCNENFFVFKFSDDNDDNSKAINYTLPERGTVSATALDIAKMLHGSNKIYKAGLDLQCMDLYTHAHPHCGDVQNYVAAGRLKPVSHLFFERALNTNDGKTLALYKTWFDAHSDLYEGIIDL